MKWRDDPDIRDDEKVADLLQELRTLAESWMQEAQRRRGTGSGPDIQGCAEDLLEVLGGE